VTAPKLPEVGELVARVPGTVYEWSGHYWVGSEYVLNAELPENPICYVDAAKGIGRKGDLIRVGFKLYEIIGYEGAYKAYKLRPFKANLSEGELMVLSGQAVVP
jgi:hypothetical protein